tara:strand:- start:24000 stop:24650 length:651 start_codon:yes stop_codon:yes gene_type:complete
MKIINRYVIFFFLICNSIFCQVIEGNKISQIYEVRNSNAEEIFSKIHFALCLIYQNPDEVIKYKDDKTMRIIVKAMALVPVLDAYKLMNPSNTELTDYIDYNHNYTAIIEVKDEKYRIKLNYQNGKYSDSQLTEYKLPFPAKMDFEASDLEEIMQKARLEMNQDYYSITSRRKKEIYIQSQPRVLKDYQQTLIDYATIYFQSIYKEVLRDNDQDKW